MREDFQTQFVDTLGKFVKRLKFLDESGAHLGLTRLYGRAATGQRVVESTPGYSGPHYTLIATLGRQEVIAPWIFEGSMNSVAFETYVRSQLLPALRPGDILVEPCINGRVVTVGAYFGVDMSPLVGRLLGEQMADGGWNCDQEIGSTRGSFHTTINVLEGLLEFERATGGSPAVTAARERGQEYLLSRHLLKRLSTGEPIEQDRKGGPVWTQFSYPAGWRYDILRGLLYMRNAGVAPDPRMAEAIEIVASKRDPDGRWALGIMHPEEVIAEPGTTEGSPSRWNTLRALQVLSWYSAQD